MSILLGKFIFMMCTICRSRCWWWQWDWKPVTAHNID